MSPRINLTPPERGKFNVEVLKQDEVWFDMYGRPYHLGEIDKEYALNILLWLYERKRHLFDPFESPLIRRLREVVLNGREPNASDKFRSLRYRVRRRLGF